MSETRTSSESAGANPQDRNAANLGDIVKHAALVKLAWLLSEAAPGGINWLDTHAYKLAAPRSPEQTVQWRAEVEGLRRSHPAYARYEASSRRSRATGFTCARRASSFKVGGAKVRAFLSEANAETRSDSPSNSKTMG